MAIMLSMGLTLTVTDFARVKEHKFAVLIGLLLQFSVMPLTAFVLSTLMSLDTELMIGMILVGTVAGGTASNVLCYLAKGDVALSISMTAVSTLAGVVLTPAITAALIGQVVDISFSDMLISLLKIVLLPVFIGVFVNGVMAKTLSPAAIDCVQKCLPLISMSLIVFIIAIIVSLNVARLHSVGVILLVAVILHNGVGLLMGYWVGKAVGFNEKVCRTLAFEVGMQNSGLAVAMAMKYFTPSAAIAGTLFSVWHNVSGSLLAGFWRRSTPADKNE
jgi:BASS family bile acid:Na+ symporter